MTRELPRLNVKTKRHNGILIWNCDIERVDGLKILEEDVFICTYPRSGTNVLLKFSFCN